MIEEPTVLILGAGASAPYGYPLGQQMVSEICAWLMDPLNNKFGIDLMALNGQTVVQAFAAEMAASQASSVDEFLEHRPDFAPVGKDAIAQAIIPHEDENKLRGGWYQYLFRALNATKERFHHNRLTIITFNYDRSLEQFLYTAIKYKYGISHEVTVDLLNTIPIFHLHGMLDPLPFFHPGGRPYSTTTSTQIIRRAATGIKIIHDDVQDSLQFRRSVQYLAEAEKICFLGFGYHRTNLERLQMKEWGFGQVYCSSYGLTNAERNQIQNRFPSSPKVTYNFDPKGLEALPFLREVGFLEMS
ncbi:MAG: hypothetical protein ABSG14_00765 [Verrucomicrobiia bacterium]|jgi:hypothetical protein